MTPEQFSLITAADPTSDGGRLVKTSAVIAPGGGTATAANQVLEIAAITAVNTAQTNGTQSTKITDGTDTLLVNADGSINVVSSGGGGTQAITSASVAVSGSVAAGATSAGLETSSDFVGTINGVARAVSRFYSFEAAAGKTLLAIPYTITGGSILIDKIV